MRNTLFVPIIAYSAARGKTCPTEGQACCIYTSRHHAVEQRLEILYMFLDLHSISFSGYYIPITLQENIVILYHDSVNDNLQQQLKLIYDYWFTQFDFPNEDGKPYRASGGEMVWSEILQKKIPLGWHINPLATNCTILLGGTPNRNNHEYWNGNINWLNSGEVAQFPVVTSYERITQKGLDNSPAKIMPKGTTVVSITGNIRASILSINTSANQSVVGIFESKKLKHPFVYQYISRMTEVFTTISTGNCQQHISKGDIENALILLPDDTTLQKYYEMTMPLYETLSKLSIESVELINLRDWLLPMLMNGQATVSD